MNCLTCNNPLTKPWQKKFCSNRCSARYNNKGVRRHGQPKGVCEHCGNEKSSVRRKYCSSACAGNARRKYTKEQRIEKERLQSRQRSARYRAALRAQTPEDADMELIQEIYNNCPEGYEVDHKIPISKGGLHHQDNLQYLTISDNRRKKDKI